MDYWKKKFIRVSDFKGDLKFKEGLEPLRSPFTTYASLTSLDLVPFSKENHLSLWKQTVTYFLNMSVRSFHFYQGFILKYWVNSIRMIIGGPRSSMRLSQLTHAFWKNICAALQLIVSIWRYGILSKVTSKFINFAVSAFSLIVLFYQLLLGSLDGT